MVGTSVLELDRIRWLGRRLSIVHVEVGGLILLASLLRGYRLTAESLWIDEIFMVGMATEQSVWALLFEVPRYEPHPPLYNVFMWAWVSLGDTSALWMRGSSVGFGVASVPVVYFLGRELFDRQTGLLAGFLFAISPFQIWYAQEARMYALLVLATVTSWYLLLRIQDRWTRQRAVGFFACGVVLGYTHVYGLFVLAVQALTTLWWTERRTAGGWTRGRLVGVFAGIGLASGPWLAELARRIVRPDSEFDDPAGWLETPGTVDLLETARIHLLGYGDVRAPYAELPGAPAVLAGVVAIPMLVLIGAWFLEKLNDHESSVLLLIGWIAGTVVLPFALSWLVQPMYELRYTIVAAPAVLLLLAAGVRAIQSAPIKVVVLILVLGAMMYPLPAYYEEPQKDQWAEAAALVNAEATDDDVVVIVPGWTDPAFGYYADDGSGERVALFQGSDQAEYDAAVADADRVFLVVSYLEDREAVIERMEIAADGPAAERHEFVAIEVLIWR